MTEHYFSHQPGVESAPKDVTVTFAEKKYVFTTDRGVFSYGKVDKATHILLDNFLEKFYGKQPETVVDVGSGYGVISCVVASRFPNAKILAVEPNERAQALTKVNFINNSQGSLDQGALRVVSPEDVPYEKVDLVISNPPIRVGKEELYSLLSFWADKLNENGQMWLVMAKHLGSDSTSKYLEEKCGLRVRRMVSKKGFRVLRATRVSDQNIAQIRPRS